MVFGFRVSGFEFRDSDSNNCSQGFNFGFGVSVFRGFGGRVYSARESGAIVSVEEDFRQLFCRPSGSGFGVWGLGFGIGVLGF